jgi:hypothetical protein
MSSVDDDPCHLARATLQGAVHCGFCGSNAAVARAWAWAPGVGASGVAARF